MLRCLRLGEGTKPHQSRKHNVPGGGVPISKRGVPLVGALQNKSTRWEIYLIERA